MDSDPQIHVKKWIQIRPKIVKFFSVFSLNMKAKNSRPITMYRGRAGPETLITSIRIRTRDTDNFYNFNIMESVYNFFFLRERFGGLPSFST